MIWTPLSTFGAILWVAILLVIGLVWGSWIK